LNGKWTGKEVEGWLSWSVKTGFSGDVAFEILGTYLQDLSNSEIKKKSCDHGDCD
jgi:hypothetical protein